MAARRPDDPVLGALSDLNRSIGRVEGQLGTFISQLKVQDERTTGLEVRTRRVENRQHWYSGAAAAIGATLGALGVHIGIKS